MEVKVPEPAWDQWFSEVKVGRTGPYQVVRGRWRGEAGSDLPPAITEWADRVHLDPAGEGADVLAMRRLTPMEPDRYLFHCLLFALAFLSATVAGGFLLGVDALATKFADIGGTWMPVPTRVSPSLLSVGLPFSVGFIGILLGHELGHYFAARYHKIPVSLPYFLPFPPYFSIVGTLGAFIRLRGPMVNRSVLFDIGVAGPFVSFVLSIPVLVVGFRMSEVIPAQGVETYPFLIEFLGEPMRVGTSPLIQFLALQTVPGFGDSVALLLHPLAFAGWLGVFVTALNLLPLGQLDGGHVLYAILGPLQRWLGWGFVVLMVPLGFNWWGWWLWGGIAVAVSRGRVAHPPVLMDQTPVGWKRQVLGWLAIVVFLISFSPAPLSF